MTIKYTDLWVGATAMVRGGFGRDPAQEVVITGVHKDIKNGHAGIDYEIPTGGSGWAYIEQIDSVSLEPVSRTITVGGIELKRVSKHKYDVRYGGGIAGKGLTREEAMKEFAECIEHELQCEGFFD